MTSLETNASDNDSQLSAKHEQEDTALKPAKRPKPKVNNNISHNNLENPYYHVTRTHLLIWATALGSVDGKSHIEVCIKR